MAKAKRRVNVLTPLTEGSWLSADQLDACWTNSVGETLGTRAPARVLCQHSPSCPSGKERLSAWVEENSHWHNDCSTHQSSDVSFDSDGLHPAVTAASIEPVQADVPGVVPIQVQSSAAASPAQPSGRTEAPTCQMDSDTAMARVDSCHSSQSSLSHASSSNRSEKEDIFNAVPERFTRTHRMKYGLVEEGFEDVHAAARRSLEQSSLSPASNVTATVPKSARQRKDPTSKLLRFLKGSPRA